MVTAGTPDGLWSYIEAFGQLASMGNLAAHVFVHALDEGDDLVRDSIVP